jgi:hypothetical protein
MRRVRSSPLFAQGFYVVTSIVVISILLNGIHAIFICRRYPPAAGRGDTGTRRDNRLKMPQNPGLLNIHENSNHSPISNVEISFSGSFLFRSTAFLLMSLCSFFYLFLELDSRSGAFDIEPIART